MTTLAVKSELDAAQALLDLHGDHGRNCDEFQGRTIVESVDGSTTIARILSSLISAKPVSHPATNTQKILKHSNSWSESFEKSQTIYTKPRPIMCDASTQTDTSFESYMLEFKKMECVVKELNAKVETMEAELKKYKNDTFTDTDLFEPYSETSSEDILNTPITRRSYKRKRTLTSTTDLSLNGNCDTTFTKERDNSVTTNKKTPKDKNKTLKPKNINNTSNEMVFIGDGNASVPARLLKHLDWTSYTHVTRKLLTAVFSRKVLATHSLTGKPSPAFPHKPAKKKLDAALVNDIVLTVVERCSVPESVVRTSITTKCADESKMFRTRQLKKKRKSVKKENIPPHKSDDSYYSC